MIQGIIGRVTSANVLKDALDVGSQRARGIADRVSKASLGNQDGFALPSNKIGPDGKPVAGGMSDVDLEGEMTDLADTNLRYEATAKLLAKAYAQVRSSLRDK